MGREIAGEISCTAWKSRFLLASEASLSVVPFLFNLWHAVYREESGSWTYCIRLGLITTPNIHPPV